MLVNCSLIPHIFCGKQMNSSNFTSGAETVFNGLSERHWAVCMCVQLAEVAMESLDAAGVISPSETCSHTSRDVIRESRGEGRVMEVRKLRAKYSVPCFLKQYLSSQPLCASPSLQSLHTPYCQVKDHLEMWALSQLWMGGISLGCPQYLVKHFSWRVHASSILWSVVFRRRLPPQPLYHMCLKVPFHGPSRVHLRDLRR